MRSIILALLLITPFLPVYAQQSTMNKSVHYDTIEIPSEAFNVVRDNATIIKLPHEHVTNWQLTIENKLTYSNPRGNAIIRLYEDPNETKFIEVGMGSPPDYRLWIAVNTPEDGYFLIHDEKTGGWSPGQIVTVQHSSNGGLSATIGQQVLVDNLDVAGFTVRDIEVAGLDSASDPPTVSSGNVAINIVSGNPAANPIFYMPFIVVGVTGVLIGVLIKTKKR
jgi:CBS domain-containing protein